VWFPQSPHTGESVLLVSTSTDLTSPITAYAWDLADNGPFRVGAVRQDLRVESPLRDGVDSCGPDFGGSSAPSRPASYSRSGSPEMVKLERTRAS
jgi:hypothetical protein